MNVVPFSASPDDSGAEPASHTDVADARQRMLVVKRTLDDAAAAVDALQSTLAAQQELELLLKQGRAHLQDLRARLQRAEADRDRFHAELTESRHAHQRDIEQHQRQLDEQTASHAQFANERADERATFTRLLNEAASKERDLMEEREEHRRHIDALREIGMRAQSLAREIVRTHEDAGSAPARRPE
jgi:predicted  nucleic acid-binding Zn-ribbon protein